MAQQTIGVGSAPNDTTGDPLRTAFTKCNDNFTDLYGAKAPLASPVFTGDPQAPTPATSDNDTSIATTAYVKANLPAAPQRTVYTSGSATYTTPAGTKWLEVEVQGGGGGGSAGQPGGGGGNGSASSFGSITANGATASTGGTASGGDINLTGGNGGTFSNAANGTTWASGSQGAFSFFGGAGTGNYGSAGGNAQPNTGAGGGGGGTNTAAAATGGAGGGAGGYCRKLITSPLASYAVTVGTGGTGGTGSGAGLAGGTGAAGIVIVTAYF